MHKARPKSGHERIKENKTVSRLTGRVQNDAYTAEKKSANTMHASVRGYHAGASIEARRNDPEGHINDNIDLSIYINHGTGGLNQFADMLIAEFTESIGENGAYQRVLKIPIAIAYNNEEDHQGEIIGVYLSAKAAMKDYNEHSAEPIAFFYSAKDGCYYGFAPEDEDDSEFTPWDSESVDTISELAEVKIVETKIEQHF